MADAEPGRAAQLTVAHALIAAGRPGAALRQAWKSVHHAVKRDDRHALEEAAELAASIRNVLEGKERQEAHVLHRYAEACLADLEPGDSRPRLPFRLRAAEPDQVKACPDCAETVRMRARVCRFCGYRFAPPPGPDPG